MSIEVSEIMTRTVATVRPDDTIRRALQLLEDLEIRHLPVVEGQRLVGVVSDRDLREYRLPLIDELEDPEYAEGLTSAKIAEAMNTRIISLESDEPLRVAIDLMLEYGVGAIPVVQPESSSLVGIVSYIDILRALRPALDDDDDDDGRP